jgi:hypothetical protein
MLISVHESTERHTGYQKTADVNITATVKVKFTLEQAMEALKERRQV